MFADDIKLVHEAIARYGLKLPFVDLGGLKAQDITVADYNITIEKVRQGEAAGAADVQSARYLHLDQNPFEDLAPGYQPVNPQYGDPPIEELPTKVGQKVYGTAVCLSVLEHVRDPFEVMRAIHLLMQNGGLVILSTLFSFPYHASPIDFWRFSPDCLRMLGEHVGFEVLEADWRLNIPADAGVLELQSFKRGEHVPQEIKTIYAVLRRAGS